jgi:hypothetical protein
MIDNLLPAANNPTAINDYYKLILNSNQRLQTERFTYEIVDCANLCFGVFFGDFQPGPGYRENRCRGDVHQLGLRVLCKR